MMRGSVHIVGPAAAVERTFECDPPRPNPPKETYYRRLVYSLALDRLEQIADAIKAHDTKHTGKVYRDEEGNAIGRGKGIMPSLTREFGEVRNAWPWNKGPAELLRTIRQAKTALYFELLQAAVNQVEEEHGQQLELFVKDSPRRDLDKLPPVVYPAHKGTKKCKHCHRPHPAALHRFHLKGSFKETHPGPARAETRRRERRRANERWTDEIPF